MAARKRPQPKPREEIGRLIETLDSFDLVRVVVDVFDEIAARADVYRLAAEEGLPWDVRTEALCFVTLAQDVVPFTIAGSHSAYSARHALRDAEAALKSAVITVAADGDRVAD